MLLRPSNTLLLDEPTNHLDLDSKDVLLEALEDYGGTLIFVSHDRYFVEKLATRIIEVGHAEAIVYRGPTRSFCGVKSTREKLGENPKPQIQSPNPKKLPTPKVRLQGGFAVARRKKTWTMRKGRSVNVRRHSQKRIAELESRIAAARRAGQGARSGDASPGFYDNLEAAKPVTDRHQALMWEVGDLIAQWEALQAHAAEQPSRNVTSET